MCNQLLREAIALVTRALDVRNRRPERDDRAAATPGSERLRRLLEQRGDLSLPRDVGHFSSEI